MRPPRRRDLTGQCFGQLKVIEFAGHAENYATLWRCECQCGGTAVTRASRLLNGTTKSCGCLSTQQRSIRYRKRLRMGPVGDSSLDTLEEFLSS